MLRRIGTISGLVSRMMDVESKMQPRIIRIKMKITTTRTGATFRLPTKLLSRLITPHIESVLEYVEAEIMRISTLPGMAERTITLNSFSKNFLMTGWRVGVIIAEPELLAVMNRVNGSLIYSAPSISQRAGIQALAMRKEIREKYVTAYRDRIFYSADRIEKIPYLSLVRPKGTFYLFPKALESDAAAFSRKALPYGLILVPSDSFGLPGYFRIAFCTDTEKVVRSIDAFKAFVKAEY